MKVLHIAASFSPLTETFIYDYIIELERKGVDNHVLTFNRVNGDDRPFDKVHIAKIERNLLWFLLRLLNEINSKPNRFWAMQRREIKKIVRQINPDIIHAHFGPMGVLVAPIAEKLKIPLVVSFYGYDISVLIKESFWIEQYLTLFDKSKLIIGMSEHICEKLKNLGCSKEIIIKFASGIKIDNFNYRDTIIDKNNEIRLIHVGRLVEKKSPILLIKAFKIVSDYYSDNIKLKLIIIGDGPLKEQAIRLAKDLSLKDKIEFLGAVNHPDIKNYLSQSHIYTQHCITAENGDQEGLGVSFLEASAIGLPIVTTNHNGIPDAVIDGVTGFLVAEGDYDSMANKIVYLIENPKIALEFGKNGRKHVEKNFDIHKQINKAIEFYKGILDERN